MKGRKYGIFVLVIIAISLIGCGECKHEFTEATCTEASKCSLCGEMNGEPLEHKFSDATCENASICSLCGEKAGEAMGHSTDLGVCSRCKEFQGEDIVKQIIAAISNGNRKVTVGNNNVDRMNNASSYDQIYAIFCDSVDDYMDAMTYYQKAIDLCGSYSELSYIKSELQNVIRACPSYPASASRTSLETWIYNNAIFLDETVYLIAPVEELANSAGCTVTEIDY